MRNGGRDREPPTRSAEAGAIPGAAQNRGMDMDSVMPAPQNRGKQGIIRTRAGQFRKGASGNPGGRPQGFGVYIRNRTKDGETIADSILPVMPDPNPNLAHPMD